VRRGKEQTGAPGSVAAAGRCRAERCAVEKGRAGECRSAWALREPEILKAARGPAGAIIGRE
jgi:hypothetical protein